MAMAIVLLAAACAGNASPSNSPGPTGSAAGFQGGPLVVGLASNLDKLPSYRFTESNVGGPGSPAPSASDDGSYMASGTVINAPVASISVREARAQFIVIGNLGWVSADGLTWMASDSNQTDLTPILPGSQYTAWFDAKASYFLAVGDETKNNVPCTHYKGNSALESIYAGSSGTAFTFQADVWIAKAGNYPVSGIFGYYKAGASGGWGFEFDITNVGDASNQMAAPTNVVAYPT